MAAVETSKSIFERFSGDKRIRVLPTLIIALVVTSVVAVPLMLRAIDATRNPSEPKVVLAQADPSLVVVDTVADDPFPLDLATVNGPLLISLQESAASSVAFSLYSAGAEDAIVSSQDLDGPQFDLIVSDSGGGTPFDSTQVPNGDYELFVTIRTPKEDRRTAVSFEIANP